MRFVLQAKDDKEAPWRVIEWENEEDMKKVNEMRHTLPQASTAAGRDRNEHANMNTRTRETRGRTASLASTTPTATPKSSRTNHNTSYSRAHHHRDHDNERNRNQQNNWHGANRFQFLRDNDNGSTTFPSYTENSRRNPKPPNLKQNPPGVGSTQQTTTATVHSVPETPPQNQGQNSTNTQREETMETADQIRNADDNISIILEDESIEGYVPKVPEPGNHNQHENNGAQRMPQYSQQGTQQQNQIPTERTEPMRCGCTQSTVCMECENRALRQKLFYLTQAPFAPQPPPGSIPMPQSNQHTEQYRTTFGNFDVDRIFRTNAQGFNSLPAQQQAFGEYLRQPKPTSTAPPRVRQNSSGRSISSASRRSLTRKTTANSKPSIN